TWDCGWAHGGSLLMTSWIHNRDCPICGRRFGLDETEGSASVFFVPSARTPGFGRTHGDFLASDDPLHGFCGQKVHWDCYARWPAREHLTDAYYRWQCSVFDRDEATYARVWESDVGALFIDLRPRGQHIAWIIWRKIGVIRLVE